MTKLLQAIDVVKNYEGFTALAGVSFAVEAGEIIAIVGPNGAGKTTLVNALTGSTAPTSGTVQFEGADIGPLSASERARRGLMRSFQLVAVFPTLTVGEMIALGVLSQEGRDFDPLRPLRRDEGLWSKVRDVAAMVELQGRLDIVCASLSQGEKKLVDIASAFALQPKVILMDEPTSGVSTADKDGIMRTLIAAARQRGVRSILLVEHDMDLVVEYSTRVIALQAGRIAADMPPKNFFADERFLESIIGVMPTHA